MYEFQQFQDEGYRAATAALFLMLFAHDSTLFTA
jgi:hypothetical protein